MTSPIAKAIDAVVAINAKAGVGDDAIIGGKYQVGVSFLEFGKGGARLARIADANGTEEYPHGADYISLDALTALMTKAVETPAGLTVSAPRVITKISEGQWTGTVNRELRAVFYTEADAIEWRQNDPLNRGTIGELMERELERNKDN